MSIRYRATLQFGIRIPSDHDMFTERDWDVTLNDLIKDSGCILRSVDFHSDECNKVLVVVASRISTGWSWDCIRELETQDLVVKIHWRDQINMAKSLLKLDVECSGRWLLCLEIC